MRAVIDARPALDGRRTGVGHYTDRLIRALPLADPGSEYVAWYLHARGLLRSRRFFEHVGAANLTESASRFPARVFQPVSWRLRVPRVEWLTGPFDALLATNFLPAATGHIERTVLVVHDLAYERYPETAPQIDARWRRRFEVALARCGAVIVPSASARSDLIARHGVPSERIHVVPHGVEAFEAVAPGVVEVARRRFDIEGPYVLFVGGLEPRKNLVRLIRSFAASAGGSTLVVAGGPVRWFPEEEGRVREAVEELPAGVRSRVALTGYVDDPDKRALLAGATALAYPSLYEGFGFPVLEAMTAGVPVLTSSVSSLPELAGDAALLVDPEDEGAIADGLRSLLEDSALRSRLAEAGRVRAATFTWEAAAARTSGVLHRVAEGSVDTLGAA